ncbi:hypothetical protein [Sporomusa sphaeroides]|uniref:hypothetical protein n=1 Tax=Sporomusa sphaeroides TaxID=47679 RepID=UPI002B7711D8|nr:hypothetical protein [Sporomusa sphaeroides]HML33154.1 hypothetical protein [Sporomusa sphaeroides]
MKILKETYQELRGVLPVAGIIVLILLAGAGQTTTASYLQTQLSHKTMLESKQHLAVSQALRERVEEYRRAFVERDYDTMYRLSYFRDVPKPSLPEYRQLRDAGYVYQINISVHEVELYGDKARAALELVVTHPVLGTNKTSHRQEWQLVDNLWYKVDYGSMQGK